jgi:hypothetical protein
MGEGEPDADCRGYGHRQGGAEPEVADAFAAAGGGDDVDGEGGEHGGGDAEADAVEEADGEGGADGVGPVVACGPEHADEHAEDEEGFFAEAADASFVKRRTAMAEKVKLPMMTRFRGPCRRCRRGRGAGRA